MFFFEAIGKLLHKIKTVTSLGPPLAGVNVVKCTTVCSWRWAEVLQWCSVDWNPHLLILNIQQVTILDLLWFNIDPVEFVGQKKKVFVLPANRRRKAQWGLVGKDNSSERTTNKSKMDAAPCLPSGPELELGQTVAGPPHLKHCILNFKTLTAEDFLYTVLWISGAAAGSGRCFF